MNPTTEPNPGNTQTSSTETADIIILGAGYGGLHVAQRLTRLLGSARKTDGTPWTILIVDRQDHHQLTTELPRLVNNEVTDASLDIPLERLLNEQRVRLHQAEIQRVKLGTDTEPNAVETSMGTLICRHLVIALGSVSNDFGIPGVRAYMRLFLTTENARELRLAVTHAVEDAARRELAELDVDSSDLQRRLTALIVGAGATGVEVAGALTELMNKTWASAWHAAGKPEPYRLPKPRVILVDAAPTVLSGWSGATSRAAADMLLELGVALHLNTPIVRVEPGRVQVKAGDWLEAGILLWTGGVRAPQLLEASGLPTGSGGRIQVDAFQRVISHPTSYAVGDSALLLDKTTGKPVPPTADIALRSGETAALALAATLRGRRPERVLRPLTRNAVSVGRGHGAANLLGVKLEGKAALALKDLIEWEYRQSIRHFHGYSLATVV